jgi:hypothetical protein
MSVAQQGVDELRGGIGVHVPQLRQPGAQLADGVEFGLVVGALAGPPPCRSEPVE